MNTRHTKIFTKWPFLTLFAFLVIAYMPVLLPFFHLKNDLITQNLPTRFFIGESVYSRVFPWWNPYINFGFPQYADMNNGFWNPVMWFIAYFFNYSVLSITIEEMFYILIGGWGVFLLCKQLKNEVLISLLCSMAYMTGGFVVGHLQHFCWITGTAFFPFVLLFFFRCQVFCSIKNLVLGGIFSFLFLSATHPGLIIGGIYFFLFLILYLFFDSKKKDERGKLIKLCLLYSLVIILLTPIIWISDLEGVASMTRGVKVSYQEALRLPTTLQSYMSLLYPLAVNKGDFWETDISMRNISLGLFCLFGLFCFFYLNGKRLPAILSGLLFFVLLSAGILKRVFYAIPLLGFVRLNGEFTYFVFLGFVLLSARGLSLALDSGVLKDWFARYTRILIGVLSLSCALSIFILLGHKQPLDLSGAKAFIDSLTFWHLLLINSIIQLLFLYTYNRFILAKPFFLFYAVHLIVLTWIVLPFTGLGQMPREKVQSIISTMPKGIFKPYQKPIINNTYIDSSYNSLLWNVAFYSKQIGYPQELPYPVLMNSASSFFANSRLKTFVFNQPFVFLSADTSVLSKTNGDSAQVLITSYSPSNIKVNVNNTGYRFLVLLQNNYPHWKVSVDGKSSDTFTIFSSFIGVPLTTGTHTVEFYFDASFLKRILYLNIAIVFSALVILCFRRVRDRKIF